MRTQKPLNRPQYGEMSEGPKEHDWKSCVPQKGTVGSNPTLSASTPWKYTPNQSATISI